MDTVEKVSCVLLDRQGGDYLSSMVDTGGLLCFEAMPPLLDDYDLIEHLLDLPNADQSIASLLILHLFSPPALEAFDSLDLLSVQGHLVLLPEEVADRHCGDLACVDSDLVLAAPNLLQDTLLQLPHLPLLYHSFLFFLELDELGAHAMFS